MLGGDNVGGAEGYALTLSKMEDSSISFHGTQLLTLSACSTAKGDAAKRWPGNGQPGDDRAAKGCGGGIGNFVGCKRREHQPPHERLLLQVGETGPQTARQKRCARHNSPFLHGAYIRAFPEC